MEYSVLITYPLGQEERQIVEREFPTCRVVIPESYDNVTLQRLIVDTDVVVGHMTPGMARAAKKLTLLHTVGHGIDFLAQDEVQNAIRDRGILVARADPAATPISEFVIMSMVLLSRRVLKLQEAMVRQGSWSPEMRRERMNGGLGGELAAKTVCVLGLGPIGVQVVHKTRAFGMRVIGVNRSGQAPVDNLELDACRSVQELEQVLPEANYLVICLPLTDETRGMIGVREFDLLPEGSYLVNVARGAIVDEDALYGALKDGKLAGAALDVWWRWGGYPSSHPIHQYNVLMTPHISGATRESGLRALQAVAENLRRLEAGKPLIGLANLDKGY